MTEKLEFNSLARLRRQDPSVQVRHNAQLGVVGHLRGILARTHAKSTTDLHKAGIAFLKKYKDLFGGVEHQVHEVIASAPDPSGGRSLVLQQYHGPHRVHGGSVRFHFARNGVLDSVSTRLAPDLDKVPLEPKTTVEQAVAAAQRRTRTRNVPEEKPYLLVYHHQGEPRLAWRVRLRGEPTTEPPEHFLPMAGSHGLAPDWIVYIDAVRGKVLEYYDNVQSAAVVGWGAGYYSATGTVNAWQAGATYQLRDTTRNASGGPEIVTDDNYGTSPSSDPDDDWNDNSMSPRSSHQGPEVDLHRYAGMAVDYFSVHHGRNSFDGNGAEVHSVAHNGDANDPNNVQVVNGAFWSNNQILVGDGFGYSPYVDYVSAQDLVTHEFTHGVTEFTCTLANHGESGALNEAVSDVFAALHTGNWLFGEQPWLNTAVAPALRNMQDPTNGGKWDPTKPPEQSMFQGLSASHYSQRYTGSGDYGGVHVNCGIINNLFYLLTNGGTHTISGVAVSGIGPTAAEQLLYRSISDHLVGQPNAGFLEFREAMVESWHDLFPYDLFKLSQIKRSFNAVGVGPDIYVRDNVADTGEEPYAGQYLWASPDIINRTALSANPAVDFGDMNDDSLAQNVVRSQPNHVYVRLQNRGSHAGDAAVTVYLTPATTFATPSSWILLGTLSEQAIAPGAVRIGGPLTYSGGVVSQPGHYCMIAVVSNSYDPAPELSLITSLTDYLSFVRDSNNFAYRNLEVVDGPMVGAGALSVGIGAVRGHRERFDLWLDLADFVPGARIFVRGPVRFLDGAWPVGLRLHARRRNEVVFEVPIKRSFPRRAGDSDGAPGFRNVLVDRPFTLRLDYELPEKRSLDTLSRLVPNAEYRLGVRQVWKGQTLGVVTRRYRPAVPPERRRARRGSP